MQTESNLDFKPHLQLSHAVPNDPLVIRPIRAWSAINLRELWTFRELLYFLTWRDLKLRYKQTLLGATWVVMQPLMMTIIFTIFLGMVARVPSGGVPYPVFAYAGLLIWSFFSNSVSSSSASVVANGNLITKVYFPRLIIPLSAVCGRLVDFAVSSVILAGLLLYYRVPLTSRVIMFPVFVCLAMLLALGTGILFSGINVKYRDVSALLPVLIQLGMYVSPVIYPSTSVPAKWRMVYDLNPMAGILEGFRSSLFGGSLSPRALIASIATSLVLLIVSLFVFRRVEQGFADVI